MRPVERRKVADSCVRSARRVPVNFRGHHESATAPALPARKIGGIVRAVGLGLFSSLHQLPEGLDLLGRVHIAALRAAIPMIEVHRVALRSGRAPLLGRLRRIVAVTTRGERAGSYGARSD